MTAPDGRLIIDPFGGPGGWAEGLLPLGLSEIGVELDRWACATRRAAGHRVVRADVTHFPVEHLTGRVDGLVMSPPCQAFSLAGNGEGRDHTDLFVADIVRGQFGCRTPPHGRLGAEVLEVGRWVETIRPRWVACEQVPPVLPIWQAYAHRWRGLHGWSTWAGVLQAADFGVPQTRQRAFLIARTDGRPARPPEPTHAKHPGASLFGELRPWVSMAEALGWDGEDQPARTVAGYRTPRWLYPDRDGTHGRVVNRWSLNRRQQSDGVPVRNVPLNEPAPTLTAIAGAKSQWVWERPATTVCGDPRLSFPGHHDEEHRGLSPENGSVRLTLPEALILQGFRPDYPVQGNKTQQFRQVGDAVPPPLAAAVVGALVGVRAEAAA